MAIIPCPRCGSTGEEPTTGHRCRFCKGAKKVEIDDQELKRILEEGLGEKEAEDKIGMCHLSKDMARRQLPGLLP